MGFSEGLQGCSGDFQRAKSKGSPHIYILFKMGFRIDPPKMHKQFCIGPTESVLSLLNPYWPS